MCPSDCGLKMYSAFRVYIIISPSHFSLDHFRAHYLNSERSHSNSPKHMLATAQPRTEKCYMDYLLERGTCGPCGPLPACGAAGLVNPSISYRQHSQPGYKIPLITPVALSMYLNQCKFKVTTLSIFKNRICSFHLSYLDFSFLSS